MACPSHARAMLPALLLAALPLIFSATAEAQLTAEHARLATRAELQASAATLDQLAASPAYGPRTRDAARTRAAATRARLATGDFRVGDVILLRVEGQISLDDTVTVREGQLVTVRGLTEVSLAGVLRSELNAKLTTAVTDVQRTATVLARPMLRLAVFGEVTSPGFFSLPGETTIDRALARAGGPTGTAAVGAMRLMRGDEVILDASAVSEAVAEGRTLDDLALRDGDAVVVPTRSQPFDRAMAMQLGTLLLGPLLTLLLVR